MSFKNILVAIDGSKESDNAVEIAVGLAYELKSKVTFLHVVNLPDLGSVALASDRSENALLGAMMDAGKKILAKAITFAQGKRVSASEKIGQGYPADTIVREAGKLKADLIVMGSRGTTGIQRVVLGSVAERVLRWSPVPVLVAKEPPSS